LKWIKDVNVRLGTRKLPGENIGETLQDIGIDRIFWARAQKYWKRKQK
jgi:hypothetical protein